MDNAAGQPTREWIHDLASRLMDGVLTPAEERQLGEALLGSPAAREIMRSYFRLEGAVNELARVEMISGSECSGVRTGLPRRRRPVVRAPQASRPNSSRAFAWAGGALAASVLLGLLYVSASQGAPLAGRNSGALATSIRTPVTAEGGPPPDRPVAPPQVSPVNRPGPAVSEERPSPKAEPPVNRDPLRPPAPQETPAKSPATDAPEPKSPPAPAEVVMTEVTVERVEGEVRLTGTGDPRVAHRGDRLASGQGLETGPDKALAVLTFPDGTRLEARPETVIRDVRPGGAPAGSPGDVRVGKTLFLQRGSIWAHVRPQPGDRPFVMGTPRGEARVLGTILTLRVDSDPKGSVRLDVQEGKVRFTRSQDGRSIDVPAGHSVNSSPGSDLTLLRSTDLLVSFQDGLAPATDYSGTRDTYISEKNPQGNFGHAKTIFAEGDDARTKHRAQWPLLRWDLSSIPTGSHVRSASISLYVTEPSHGYAYYLYEPSRPWSETETTWRLAATGAPWRLPGSLGGIDRWGPPLGILAPLVKGEYTAILNDAGVALVQTWINTPSSNVGFIIASPEPAAGFHFNSRRASGSETRPKLTLVYQPHR